MTVYSNRKEHQMTTNLAEQVREFERQHGEPTVENGISMLCKDGAYWKNDSFFGVQFTEPPGEPVAAAAARRMYWRIRRDQLDAAYRAYASPVPCETRWPASCWRPSRLHG